MKVFSSLMNVCRYRFLLKYLSSVEKKSDENAKPVGANHVTNVLGWNVAWWPTEIMSLNESIRGN